MRSTAAGQKPHPKPLVEAAPCLDLSHAQLREILSQPDPTDALVLFTRAGVPVAELALHCGPAEDGHRELVVVFDVQRRQTLTLELVHCGFHPRWLARCGCGRRARKLYLTEEPKVCCWRCAGLQYTSAQEHDARLDALKRDLPALLLASFDMKRPNAEPPGVLVVAPALGAGEAGPQLAVP